MSEVVATAQQGLAGKYKPYPQYKDSGVEWLGVIPTHWSLHALKRTVSGCSNGIWGDEPKGEDDLIVLRVADFDRNKLTVSDDKLTYRSISEKERKTRLLKKGDLLIEKSGGGEKTLVGCVVIFDKDYSAVTSNFVAKMSPRKTYCSNFLRYAFSHLYAGRVNYPSIKQTTGIQNLDSDSYLMEHFCFPDSSEQQTIAAFLDYETTRIDRLIAKQQQLIELLKEKRQTVISHAVTKGLNPDAPMKDSGVEWLGQVPEHWVVSDLSYTLSAIADIDHYMPESVDIGVPYLMTGDLKNFAHEIDFSECKQVSYVEYGKLSRKIQASIGDVIVARYATIGTATYVDIDKEFLVSYACVTVKPNLHKVAGLYLYYFIKSHSFLEGLLNKVNTNTQGNVGINDLKKVKISLPDVQEQGEVVLYLESITKKIDSLSRQAERAITLMNERRTALISAAVTGKIDLRGWTQPAEEVAA